MPDDIDKLLDNMPDEQLAQLYERLAEMGILQYQAPTITGRLKAAQALAGTPLPEGRQVGRIYKAPHPLEYVANVLQRTMGMRDAERLRLQEDKSVEEMRTTMRQLAEGLARRYGGG